MSSIPLFSLYAKLSLEGANEFQRGLSAIETYAGRAAAAVRGLTSATTNMLGALGGGVAFGETLGFFGRLEASQKRLEAVLTATGNAAGFSGRQLLDYARKAADVGPFTRQSVVQAEAALARFGEIRGDTYMKALEKAKSLAALTGQDLPQAAETLGYALSDPTGRGLSRLQRLARLPVLPSEHRRIEALSVNPQTRPQAQELILSKIPDLTEAFNTLEGRVANLRSRVRTMLEEWGRLFVPVVNQMISAVNSLTSWLGGLHASTITATANWVAWGAALRAVRPLVHMLVSPLQNLIEALGRIGSGAVNVAAILRGTMTAAVQGLLAAVTALHVGLRNMSDELKRLEDELAGGVDTKYMKQLEETYPDVTARKAALEKLLPETRRFAIEAQNRMNENPILMNERSWLTGRGSELATSVNDVLFKIRHPFTPMPEHGPGVGEKLRFEEEAVRALSRLHAIEQLLREARTQAAPPRAFETHPQFISLESSWQHVAAQILGQQDPLDEANRKLEDIREATRRAATILGRMAPGVAGGPLGAAAAAAGGQPAEAGPGGGPGVRAAPPLPGGPPRPGGGLLPPPGAGGLPPPGGAPPALGAGRRGMEAVGPVPDRAPFNNILGPRADLGGFDVGKVQVDRQAVLLGQILAVLQEMRKGSTNPFFVPPGGFGA